MAYHTVICNQCKTKVEYNYDPRTESGITWANEMKEKHPEWCKCTVIEEYKGILILQNPDGELYTKPEEFPFSWTLKTEPTLNDIKKTIDMYQNAKAYLQELAEKIGKNAVVSECFGGSHLAIYIENNTVNEVKSKLNWVLNDDLFNTIKADELFKIENVEETIIPIIKTKATLKEHKLIAYMKLIKKIKII